MNALLSDRAAAQEFLEAIGRYNDESRKVRYLKRNMIPYAKSCSSFADQSEDRQGAMVEIELVFRGLMQGKLSAILFEDLAKRLRGIPTKNSALKTVATSVGTVAANTAPKLKTADIDLCQHLRNWQETGWSTRAYDVLVNAPFTIFQIDRKSYVDAVKQTSSAGLQIQKIDGVSFHDALEITSVVYYF